MRRRKGPLSHFSLVVFTICLCLATVAQCLAGVTRLGQVYVPDQYIIRVAEGTSLELVEQAVAKMGATLVRPVAVNDTYLVKLGRTGSQASCRISSRSTLATKWVIESVQPNYRYYLHSVPNDEYWGKQWNMKLINMPSAWEIEKGSSDVVVAVIDTGVANHPDLVDRLVDGTDVIDDDDDPSNDLVGHGTHCAGIIAAEGNNGIGVCGVNWSGVKIMPVRVFGEESSTTDLIVAGEDFALENEADVASMSYGMYYDDPVQYAKIQEMAAASMVLVSSAGNDATSYPSYPAGYSEVISVSAIGPYDAIAYYSNYGKIDIAAPGGDDSLGTEAEVYSTIVTWSGDTATMGYDYMEGTSMACPHVSGAAALLLSYGVPANDVADRLSSGARAPKSGTMDSTRYGAGVLNVQGSLANAVLHIISPGKGATVGTSPDFRIQIQGINTTTVRVYLDYADINDDGIPDDEDEGVVIDGTTVNSYLNTTSTEIDFNWSDISTETSMTAGTHNLYVSADATAGGDTVSDWGVFTVAKTKISKGLHLFAFPYAFSSRTTDTPSTVLPGAKFALSDSPRSVLWSYIAAPQSATNSSPVGYVRYTPSSSTDRVWVSPYETISGTSIPTGGGYYYDLLTSSMQFAYPAGTGFWLVLPTDIYIDETYEPLETLANVDGSKGFQIPLYKGYNLIGNPYAHSVSWRAALFTYRGVTKTLLDAEDAGWVRSSLYGYSGSAYERVSNREMLEPYCGYWLYALIGGIEDSDSLTLNILP